MENENDIVIDQLLIRTAESVERSLSSIDVEARLEALRRRAAAEVADAKSECVK